jgi:hypothetical protein
MLYLYKFYFFPQTKILPIRLLIRSALDEPEDRIAILLEKNVKSVILVKI